MSALPTQTLLLQELGRRLLFVGDRVEGDNELLEGDSAGPGLRRGLLQPGSGAVQPGRVHLCPAEHHAGAESGPDQRRLPGSAGGDQEAHG